MNNVPTLPVLLVGLLCNSHKGSHISVLSHPFLLPAGLKVSCATILLLCFIAFIVP